VADSRREVNQVLGIARGETDVPDAASMGGEELLLRKGRREEGGGLRWRRREGGRVSWEERRTLIPPTGSTNPRSVISPVRRVCE